MFVFDLLHLDGTDLLDLPTSDRLAAMDAIVPAVHRVNRLITDDASAAQAFLDVTLAAGHEGVMAKSLSAPYEAGRRGAGWLKVKPVHTLDLVVLGVESGIGHRTGKLSNIHLGARDAATGEFVMLGKTFKGMTDAMLEWQTARFMELADEPTDGYVVKLRPEQVVEIAFDGVQGSSRYPGGHGAAVRARAAVPRRQESGRRRHHRHSSRPLPARRLNEERFARVRRDSIPTRRGLSSLAHTHRPNEYGSRKNLYQAEER